MTGLLAGTVLWLVEQLMDGGLPGQQEVSQGLAGGAALQQHGGHQGLSDGLVRHGPAPQQRPAVQQDGGPAGGQTVTIILS